MSFTAVVFPGQGAQRLGMAQDFVDAYSVAQQVFAEAKASLPFDPYHIIVNDAERLNLTEFTQPCIVAAEIAMLRVAKDILAMTPQYFAGHSLGEYSALVAAGVMPLEVALPIVHKRGQLMQQAMPVGEGSMAAIIMQDLPFTEIKAIAQQYEVDVANYNSLKQVVVSGKKAEVDAVVAALEKQYAEAIRCVVLEVSAAFHSRYIEPIAAEFSAFLQSHKQDFKVANLPQVMSNYSGKFYQADLDQLVDYLTKQLYSSVQWQQNMELLCQQTRSIIEIGPGRPLKGFFQAMDVNIPAITSVRMMQRVEV
jgi:[acyl-carrier-protein] S-malonyltransferase